MSNRFPRLPRVFCFLLVVLVTSSAVHADDKPAAKKHFLWKVKSKTATVYLLGSIHAAKKDLYPLDDVIENAFKASSKVAFEVPLDAETQREAQTKMLKAARYDAGDSLDKHLSDDVKKELDAYLKKAMVPAGAFNSFKPWMVSLTVTMLELQKAGFTPGQGIDQHYLKKAQAAKKEILGLETVDDQVGLFKNLDEKTQMKMLKQSLEESATIGETLEKAFKAWKAGDGKKLDDLMLKPARAKEYKAMYAKLFTDRNKAMTKKIVGFLKTEGTYFVIVGAGHLVGEDGIVELLKAKKFKPVQQ